MPALFPFSRFPDFLEWSKALAQNYKLISHLQDPSTLLRFRYAARAFPLISHIATTNQIF